MTAALYQTPQSAELQVPRPGPRWGARFIIIKTFAGGHAGHLMAYARLAPHNSRIAS